MFISRKALAERWQCSTDAIAKMEAEGTLTRVGNGKAFPPGILYRMDDILIIEGGGDASPTAPWERKRLETKIAEQEAVIKQLREQLQDIYTAASVGLTAVMGR